MSLSNIMQIQGFHWIQIFVQFKWKTHFVYMHLCNKSEKIGSADLVTIILQNGEICIRTGF